MADTHLFWQVAAAVLIANLLTVMFVWAGVHISHKERRQESFWLYLGCFLMPMLFALGAFSIANGGG